MYSDVQRCRRLQCTTLHFCDLMNWAFSILAGAQEIKPSLCIFCFSNASTQSFHSLESVSTQHRAGGVSEAAPGEQQRSLGAVRERSTTRSSRTGTLPANSGCHTTGTAPLRKPPWEEPPLAPGFQRSIARTPQLMVCVFLSKPLKHTRTSQKRGAAS